MSQYKIPDSPITSMVGILKRCQQLNSSGITHKVSVPAAHDKAVIEAVTEARKNNIADAILFGDSEKINQLLESVNSEHEFEIVQTSSDVDSANQTAASIASGDADIILKGMLSTGTILKSILKREYGLRKKGLLSHTAVLAPKRYPKLLSITDGGMVVKPDFDQKIEIIRNAVLVGWALGIKIPKVAVLTTIDYIVAGHEDLFEAAALSKMAERGQIESCAIDGPLSFDTAVWQPSLRGNLRNSSVAGDADILLTGSIEEGNIIAKSIVQYGEASFAGVILGAKAPISLVSRADNAFNKMVSIALAVIVSNYSKSENIQ